MKIDTILGENIKIGAYRTARPYNKRLCFGDRVILVRIVSKYFYLN
jgi:hypothetical protein